MIVKLLRGTPTVAHLTAPKAVVPGEVVNIGKTPVIAVNRCANGEEGAFAVGGGVYAATAQTSTGAPVAGSRCVFATNIKLDTQNGNHFGIALKVAAATCEVYHQPHGVELNP